MNDAENDYAVVWYSRSAPQPQTVSIGSRFTFGKESSAPPLSGVLPMSFESAEEAQHLAAILEIYGDPSRVFEAAKLLGKTQFGVAVSWTFISLRALEQGREETK